MKRRALIILCLAGTAAAFFALSAATPYYADDYSYMFTYAAGAAKERVTTLAGLIASQANHYQIINGRAVVHTLVQLFLMGPRIWFDIANTLVFLALGLCMCRAAWGKGERTPLRLLAPWALLFLTLPGFGQSCLWLTGSVNYMWTSLAALAFLLPYAVGVGRLRPAAAALIMPLAGLLAGWSGENACLGAMAGLALLLLRKYALNRERFELWTLTGALGFLAGAAALLFAPAQGVRVSGTGGMASLGEMLRRVLPVSVHALEYLWLPLALGALCLIASVLQSRGRGFMYWLRRWSDTLCWAGAAVVSAYCMCAAPYFPLRAWCAAGVFAAVTVLSVFAELKMPERLAKPLALAACAAALAACAACYISGAGDILETRAEVIAREDSVAEQKAAGAEEVFAPSVAGSSRYNCFAPEGDLVEDPDSWQNGAMALYFGVERVIMLPES